MPPATRAQIDPQGLHPGITPHELDLLQDCLARAITQSWLTQPAYNFGFKRAGTPKVANWICALTSSRSFKQSDPGTLVNLVQQYKKTLIDGWPDIRLKPNLHVSEQIAQVVELYGPPASIACWFAEQFIGELLHTPKNGHLSWNCNDSEI
ncbi:hypothetical protein CROQUDRAFT_134005 [Cronartium quercuum f. sp. fusiforme G11]|uniref:Uncharacterized protein n=1 Tax=Cronartium quercuum f. sp. fusiforme G11 TaxID=708437 RepID=A0A9P6TAW9_9BASI|nr:hypothetical protein CROQUDRAFT_134005 [Cronartium quercuum f. sp. fusiforme G11]